MNVSQFKPPGFEVELDSKTPLFIRSNVAVSIATDPSGYQVLFALALTPCSLVLLILVSDREHGLLFSEVFWK